MKELSGHGQLKRANIFEKALASRPPYNPSSVGRVWALLLVGIRETSIFGGFLSELMLLAVLAKESRPRHKRR